MNHANQLVNCCAYVCQHYTTVGTQRLRTWRRLSSRRAALVLFFSSRRACSRSESWLIVNELLAVEYESIHTDKPAWASMMALRALAACSSLARCFRAFCDNEFSSTSVASPDASCSGNFSNHFGKKPAKKALIFFDWEALRYSASYALRKVTCSELVQLLDGTTLTKVRNVQVKILDGGATTTYWLRVTQHNSRHLKMNHAS